MCWKVKYNLQHKIKPMQEVRWLNDQNIQSLGIMGIMGKGGLLTFFLALGLWVIPISSFGNKALPSERTGKEGKTTLTFGSNEYILAESKFLIEFPTDASQPHPLRRRRSLRREKALLVGVNLLGATMNYGSAYLGYALGRVVNLETGIDLSTAYGGISLHPVQFRKIEGLSPYMGLMAGYSGVGSGQQKEEFFMYMPVGVRYLTPDNWHISIEVAATTADNIRTGPLFGGIKLGYYFKL